jgi:hypothetical protein
MLIGSGFEVARVVKNPSGVKWLKIVNRLSGDRLIDYLVRQYIVVAVKKDEVTQ